MEAKLTFMGPARRATWRRAGVLRENRIRQRIACRLHDDVGQLLVLQGLKLGELGRVVGQDAAVLVRELQALLNQTAVAARAAVLELAEPVCAPALMPALQDVASQVTSYGFLTVMVEDRLPQLAIPHGEVRVVRRIVQELCLNAQKHAQARQVVICASIEAAQLCISVADDGAGLTRRLADVKPDAGGGFGLASAQAQLRALGGRLQVRSEPGLGTCVSLLLPQPANG